MIKAVTFNEKYGLTGINRDWFREPTLEEKEVKAQRIISGRNQNVWTDVVKRFFKNKWNVIFTIIFIALMLLVIIAPLASKFTQSNKVSGAQVEQISFLKPKWLPNWDHRELIDKYHDIVNGVIPGIINNGPNKNVISITHILDHSGQDTGSALVVYRNLYAVPTILGTDSIGRDVWTRLWSGAGWSLRLAFLVATIETVVGVSLGIYVGTHVGKKVDTLVMRLIEIFQSVPALLWMFLFAMVLGTGFWSMALVLILVGWAPPIYSARMFTMKIKDAEFVKAAESIGVSPSARIFRHILPNIIGRLLVLFVQRIPAVIFFETTLIFLGMAVGENGQSTIGNLIQDSRSSQAIDSNLTYTLSIVGFLLVMTVSMQIIANGLRDAFDPRLGA